MAVSPAKLKAFVKEEKKRANPRASEEEDESDEEKEEGDEDKEKEEGEGNPDGDGEEDDGEIVERSVKEVEEGGDEKLMKLVDGYDPEEEGNPPAWVASEAIWERAKKAVEDSWEDYEEPWAVVAHVYSNMGGETK